MANWIPPGLSQINTQFLDCCDQIQVTEYDEREILFWNAIYPELNKVFDKVVANEAFGMKDDCQAQNLMDVQHLLLFLKLIDYERDFDAEQSEDGLDYGNAYYIEKYCTKTIQDRFYCKGFSLQTIMYVFQLFNLILDEYVDDGIGFMEIGGTADPINRVF